jgi:predicted RNA-binding Zn ribbon-like protein
LPLRRDVPVTLQRDTPVHGVTLLAMDVEAMAVPMLVDLVNGWGTVPRARAADRPLASRAALVEAYAAPDEPVAHCIDEAVARVAHGTDDALARVAHGTDDDLVRVADELYAVFAAAEAEERARLVTALLARCDVRPAARAVDGRIRPTWRVARQEDALLAAGGVALRAQLAEHHPARLGTCESRSCGDVFVDASPGAHRRFCSVTCQNRERVAAFRRRRAAGPPDSTAK